MGVWEENLRVQVRFLGFHPPVHWQQQPRVLGVGNEGKEGNCGEDGMCEVCFYLRQLRFCAVLDVVEPGTGNSELFLFVCCGILDFLKAFYLFGSFARKNCYSWSIKCRSNLALKGSGNVFHSSCPPLFCSLYKYQCSGVVCVRERAFQTCFKLANVKKITYKDMIKYKTDPSGSG